MCLLVSLMNFGSASGLDQHTPQGLGTLCPVCGCVGLGWQADRSKAAIHFHCLCLCCQAFEKTAKGEKGAMAAYNQVQINQLTKLIAVTCKDLSKPDRQKIM